MQFELIQWTSLEPFLSFSNMMLDDNFFLFFFVWIFFADLKYKAKVNDGCKCQCLSHLAAFREDLNICVDDIHGKCN